MKCKDCFMYSICDEECGWYDKPVDANDSADDCPNFDYYPNDTGMSMMNINEDGMSERVLKSCPFCDGFARVLQDERLKKKNHDFPKWYITCQECGVKTPIAEMSTVVKIWNRRVTE